tara:strand:- start:386 stop:772 length:387 start_codon:yes stop_codon:yes gene_type:complete
MKAPSRNKKKPAPFPGNSSGMKPNTGRPVGRPKLDKPVGRPRLDTKAGGKPKAGGKRKRISADKVKGPILMGGSNVGKRGVIGQVGGKDVVGVGYRKKKKTGNLGKGLPAGGRKRRKNKPSDPKLLRR